LRREDADDALDDAPYDQRVGIAGALDHAVDRETGEDGAEAIARRGEAGGKAATVGKPAHHEPDDADIDDSGAEPAEHAIGEVERPDIVDRSGKNPACAGQ